MLHGLAYLVREVRVLSKAFLEEGRNLALEVGLATKSNLRTFIRSDQSQRSLAFFVAGEAEAVSDHHLLDKVVLSVLNDTESHDVKESVAIGIGHHRIGPGRPDQFLECLPVELGGSNVDRRLAIDITYEGAGTAVLKQGIDHKGVTAKDGHIERQLRSAIDLRSLLLHDHVQDAEVEVARVL